ncbi:hypothetical protein MHLP_01685 [Candidatus Mycoplasma haematolamae str. Purdue]|uniref:Uncharacterized protein n=1 Tax=Mycoplasma haematolamae (strain Purdue) TaxID=1212765 RepID=I7C5X7_MYCHA|nr:hypothetical protein [Candidatus Mycoplasma haematolamae]AFO51917.1 hypothetical protein MHLP_01685 [Candidatus Mycoplasma haematolamae str. Purdue]
MTTSWVQRTVAGVTVASSLGAAGAVGASLYPVLSKYFKPSPTSQPYALNQKAPSWFTQKDSGKITIFYKVTVKSTGVQCLMTATGEPYWQREADKDQWNFRTIKFSGADWSLPQCPDSTTDSEVEIAYPSILQAEKAKLKEQTQVVK